MMTMLTACKAGGRSGSWQTLAASKEFLPGLKKQCGDSSSSCLSIWRLTSHMQGCCLTKPPKETAAFTARFQY